VVEGPIRLVEQPHPLFAHVVVPIVFARNEYLANLDFRQQLNAERKLVRSSELGKIAAEDQEVGRRAHILHFFGGTLHFLDEPRIDRLRIEVGVGDPCKLERLFGRIRHVDRVNQWPPSEGLSDCSSPCHA
jgi:hypothetical protein